MSSYLHQIDKKRLLERASAALGEIAQTLVAASDDPPYEGLIAALPDATRLMEQLAAQARELALSDLQDRLEAITKSGRDLATRKALGDEDAIAFAEALDSVQSLVTSLNQEASVPLVGESVAVHVVQNDEECAESRGGTLSDEEVARDTVDPHKHALGQSQAEPSEVPCSVETVGAECVHVDTASVDEQVADDNAVVGQGASSAPQDAVACESSMSDACETGRECPVEEMQSALPAVVLDRVVSDQSMDERAWTTRDQLVEDDNLLDDSSATVKVAISADAAGDPEDCVALPSEGDVSDAHCASASASCVVSDAEPTSECQSTRATGASVVESDIVDSSNAADGTAPLAETDHPESEMTQDNVEGAASIQALAQNGESSFVSSDAVECTPATHALQNLSATIDSFISTLQSIATPTSEVACGVSVPSTPSSPTASEFDALVTETQADLPAPEEVSAGRADVPVSVDAAPSEPAPVVQAFVVAPHASSLDVEVPQSDGQPSDAQVQSEAQSPSEGVEQLRGDEAGSCIESDVGAPSAPRDSLADVLEFDSCTGLMSVSDVSTQDVAAGVADLPADPQTVAEAVTAPEAQAVATGEEAPAVAAFAPDASVESGELSADQMLMLLAAEEQAATWGTIPLALPPEKAELLQFLVNDVKAAADQMSPLVPMITDLGVRDEACAEFVRLSEVMAKATREFEFRSLAQLITLVGDIGFGVRGVAEEMLPEITMRLLGVQSLIQQHAVALEVGMETTWPLQILTARIHRLLSGQKLAENIIGWHKRDTERVLELDKVVEGIEPPPEVSPVDDHGEWIRPAVDAADAQGHSDIVKVEVHTIDALLSIIGEMARHRSRIQVLSDALRREAGADSRVADICREGELLERSMVSLQTGLMGTRLQPLCRLLDNYPRVIRDVARIADREAIVTICGGDTLVDKSTLDGLAEPLMTVLRFVASKLIESPAEREKAGKTSAGNITITARHQGSQVVILIDDDGAGFDRNEISSQAVQSGLFSEEQAATVTDDELAALCFEGDLPTSTVARVTSMLRNAVGGSLNVKSFAGKGSRIEVVVPVKSTILPCVLVAAGKSCYTVPLQAVTEITRIDPECTSTIGGARCIKIRENLFPLIDARALFGDEQNAQPAFALVLRSGDTFAALGVDKVLSKQDMIISQIDEPQLRRGPFSGTTLTSEGSVSLVIDVQRVLSAGLRASHGGHSATQ
jgi:chemotaxis protein histidine kinase CheA